MTNFKSEKGCGGVRQWGWAWTGLKEGKGRKKWCNYILIEIFFIEETYVSLLSCGSQSSGSDHQIIMVGSKCLSPMSCLSSPHLSHCSWTFSNSASPQLAVFAPHFSLWWFNPDSFSGPDIENMPWNHAHASCMLLGQQCVCLALTDNVRVSLNICISFYSYHHS